MKKIIESPFTDGNAVLSVKPKKMTFRKEEFEVYDYYYTCEITKKEFITTEAGDATLSQLYNQYREKNNIMFPIEITELREHYGLSASKMSEILGFGTNIYKNYENGDIPNKSNAKMLELAGIPYNFLTLANESKCLSDLELKDLEKNTDVYILYLKEQELKKCYRVFYDNISQYTGYMKKHLDKIANMVIYFLAYNDRTYKTRLNKYLFYSDFLSYKYNSVSISGYRYSAIDKGPVPDSYALLYDILEQEGYIRNEEKEIDGNEISKLIPLKSFDESLFNEEELQILNDVIVNLQFKKTEDIIEKSHNTNAWKDNIASKSQISYQKYAYEIEL